MKHIKILFSITFFLVFIKPVSACECEKVSFWQTVAQSEYIVIAKVTSTKTTKKIAGKVEILNQLKGEFNKKYLSLAHTECSENLRKYSVGDTLILVPTYDETTKKIILSSCHESILTIKNGVASGYFSYSPKTDSVSQQFPLEKLIGLLKQYISGSYTANYQLFSHYISSPNFLNNYPIPAALPINFDNKYWEYSMQMGSASGLGSKSHYRYDLKNTDTLNVQINTHSRYREWENGRSLIKDTNIVTQDTFYHWGNNYYSNWYDNNAFEMRAFTQEMVIKTDNMRLSPGSFLDLTWGKNYAIALLEKPYSIADSMQITFFETQKNGEQWGKQQTHTYKKVKTDTNAFGRGIYEPYKYVLLTYQGNFDPTYGKTRSRTIYYIPDYDILFFDLFNLSLGAMVPKNEEAEE